MNDCVTAGVAAPAGNAPARSTRMRWFEVGLVVFVAFGQPLLSSFYTAFFGFHNSNAYSVNARVLLTGIHELGALLVVWYVLRQSGRTFQSLGIHATLRTFFVGLVLAAVSRLAFYLAAAVIQVGHWLCFGIYATFPNRAALYTGGSLAVMIPFFTLNPFFEETIVRGYLMTELSELSGSMAVATLTSVAIQGAYHLYLGWFAATCLSASFLVLAVYYARTRKLFPVLIAHAIADWWFLFQLVAAKPH